MFKTITKGLVIAALAGFSTVALAGEWKDGVLFTQKKIDSLKGHDAYSIEFGLVPGKCTGEITAVSEWLKMTEGTMVFAYTGKSEVSHSKGDEWYQANGTKVNVCNKSSANAMLVGVQFRPAK